MELAASKKARDDIGAVDQVMEVLSPTTTLDAPGESGVANEWRAKCHALNFSLEGRKVFAKVANGHQRCKGTAK